MALVSPTPALLRLPATWMGKMMGVMGLCPVLVLEGKPVSIPLVVSQRLVWGRCGIVGRLRLGVGGLLRIAGLVWVMMFVL